MRRRATVRRHGGADRHGVDRLRLALDHEGLDGASREGRRERDITSSVASIVPGSACAMTRAATLTASPLIE